MGRRIYKTDINPFIQMKIKQLHFTGAFLALLALTFPDTLQAREYKIPATQEEFESMWEVVPGEVENTWTWVDAAVPYASSPTVNEGEKGASLILKEPVSMNEGEIFNLQALVSTNHFNNDGWFYIVYGTDKSQLTAMPDDAYSFKCWGKSDGTPDFKVKPADSSSKKTLNITESGDYYIGIRTKKGSNSNTVFCLASLLIEKDVNYPQKVSSAKATADAEGGMEVTLTWTWPTKNKDNSLITEELGANIYRHTSNSKSELYKPENLIATVTGGVAGQTASFTDNAANSSTPLTEAGKYYYYIAPFNSDGENNDCTTSNVTECKWVGEDVRPLNPLNVKAKAVGDDVEVSWEARIQGYNGGYLDPEYFSHKITRTKDGGEPVIIVENYKGESPYLDTTLEGPGTYTYSVCAVYREEESSTVKSSSIFAGGAYDIPFEDDFSDSDRFKLYTSLSSSSSYGSGWTRDYSGYIKLCGPYYGSVTASLLTPPLKVVAGKTYKISCTSWVDEEEEEDPYGWGGYTEPDPKDLLLTAGSEATLDGQATLGTFTINQAVDNKMNVEAYFSPTESGSIYFGVKSTPANRNYIYVDNLKIEESIMLPATVSDLTAVPEANGATQATVSFTMPDKSNSGMPLTDLSKVTVTRSNYLLNPESAEVVKTFEGEGAIPGHAVSFVDEVPEAGMYFYAVTSILGEQESEPASSSNIWIGYDTPKDVTSFTIRAESDGSGNATVNWSALSETQLGIHGGFVDAANLKYRIYRKPTIDEGEFELVGESSENTFTDTSLKNAPWENYTYGVTALNGTRESVNISTGNKLAGGKITELPYSPDLTSDKFVESLPGRAFISENGITFKNRGEQGTSEYIAYLPPFDAVTGENVKYTLDMELYRGNAEYEELVEVLLCEIERRSLDPESEGDLNAESVVIPGEDNRTSLQEVPVHALSEEPAQENIVFTVPAEGRYRIALRCASADNKRLTIQSLKLDKTGSSMLNGILSDNGIVIEGNYLRLPADTSEVVIYTTDGIKVSAYHNVDSIDMNTFAPGVYIVRAVTKTNRSLNAKVILK